MESPEIPQDPKLERKPDSGLGTFMRRVMVPFRSFLDQLRRRTPDLNTGFEKRPNQLERAEMSFDTRPSVLKQADRVSRNAQANARVEEQRKGG